MWCARRHEKRVSCLYAPVNKEMFQGLSFDAFQKMFRFCLRHESNKYLRSRLGRNGMPHFCFAATARGLFVTGGVSVIGMDLDRQFVVGKNEFARLRLAAPSNSIFRGRVGPRSELPRGAG